MLHTDNVHRMIPVQDVVQESPTVRTLTFSDSVMSNALPGQFAMVWIPGAGELPMSIMVSGSGMAAFTVRRHGPTSTGLYNVPPGQTIGIRGPYGNSFDLHPGRIMLVGGGTGLVPLMRLMTRMDNRHDVQILMGARTADEVFFNDLPGKLLHTTPYNVVVATEDGTRGHHGLITDVAEAMMSESKFDAVYTCGPELMMYKTVLAASEAGIFAQASLERMMKCGFGICGSCCMGPDLTCRDGTVFEGRYLLQGREFGHSYRDKAGLIRDY